MLIVLVHPFIFEIKVCKRCFSTQKMHQFSHPVQSCSTLSLSLSVKLFYLFLSLRSPISNTQSTLIGQLTQG